MGNGVGRRIDYDKLTRTEWKISLLVARGMSDLEIGKYLNTTRQTVRTHIKHTFLKLGLKNRVQLAVWYTEERISGRVPNSQSEFTKVGVSPKWASVRPDDPDICADGHYRSDWPR